MACGCESIVEHSEYTDGICEVCRLMNEDTSVKKIKYCETCGVNICCECNTNYPARFFAMLKSKFGI